MAKIEEALQSISTKATELNTEYGLTSALKDVLTKAGDLSVEAIDSGLKFAEEVAVGCREGTGGHGERSTRGQCARCRAHT